MYKELISELMILDVKHWMYNGLLTISIKDWYRLDYRARLLLCRKYSIVFGVEYKWLIVYINDRYARTWGHFYSFNEWNENMYQVIDNDKEDL